MKFSVPLRASILRMLWKKKLPKVSQGPKGYRGQTEVMFGCFCQKKLFKVKRRRAVYVQDTNTKFGPKT